LKKLNAVYICRACGIVFSIKNLSETRVLAAIELLTDESSYDLREDIKQARPIQLTTMHECCSNRSCIADLVGYEVEA